MKDQWAVVDRFGVASPALDRAHAVRLAQTLDDEYPADAPHEPAERCSGHDEGYTDDCQLCAPNWGWVVVKTGAGDAAA